MPPSASAIPPTQTTQRVPNRSSKPIDRGGEDGAMPTGGTDGGGTGGSGGGEAEGCRRRLSLRRRDRRGRGCRRRRWRLWRGRGWRRRSRARAFERAQPLIQAANGAELRQRHHERGNGDQWNRQCGKQQHGEEFVHLSPTAPSAAAESMGPAWRVKDSNIRYSSAPLSPLSTKSFANRSR
jgi:hypothetical protein